MDITTLSIAVDSTQVNTASAALEKFAVTGGKAETSALALEKASANQGRALGALVPQATKAATAVGDLADASKELSDAGKSSGQSIIGKTASEAAKAAKAAADLEIAQAKLARATAAASAAQEKLNNLQLLSASIKPQAIAEAKQNVQDTSSAQSLAAARLQSAQLAVATTSAGTAAGKASVQIDQLGKSSKLAAFQQQQLGFQLHDFFVQVSSGQSPITAFVQQGSQLSGTFGGAGNALKAVLGLLTPVRVVGLSLPHATQKHGQEHLAICRLNCKALEEQISATATWQSSLSRLPRLRVSLGRLRPALSVNCRRSRASAATYSATLRGFQQTMRERQALMPLQRQRH
jgi:hypothetical protein